MKEMDPSEEILMEQAMMEDEDLLIEVESMRQTLKKLDRLPQIEPPSYVQDAILEKASNHAEKRKLNKTLKPAFKYAVAATLALTVTAGGMWFYIGGEGSKNQSQQSSSQPLQAETSANANLSLSSSTVENASSGDSKIEPWVDRNNILHFEDHFLNGNSNFEAILNNSTQKLQLIETPLQNNRSINHLQLTGSGN
jgi:hypothetical protein